MQYVLVPREQPANIVIGPFDTKQDARDYRDSNDLVSYAPVAIVKEI